MMAERACSERQRDDGACQTLHVISTAVSTVALRTGEGNVRFVLSRFRIPLWTSSCMPEKFHDTSSWWRGEAFTAYTSTMQLFQYSQTGMQRLWPITHSLSVQHCYITWCVCAAGTTVIFTVLLQDAIRRWTPCSPSYPGWVITLTAPYYTNSQFNFQSAK